MRYVKSLKPAWQSSKFCLQHILVLGHFASLPTLRNHGKLEFFVHFKPCSFSLPVQQTEKTSTEGHGNVWGDLNLCDSVIQVPLWDGGGQGRTDGWIP